MTQATRRAASSDAHRFEDGETPHRGSSGKAERNERILCCLCGGRYLGATRAASVALLKDHELPCFEAWRDRLPFEVQLVQTAPAA
jgi:hypothetical protein